MFQIYGVVDNILPVKKVKDYQIELKLLRNYGSNYYLFYNVLYSNKDLKFNDKKNATKLYYCLKS